MKTPSNAQVAPEIRPDETLDQTFNRLTAWALVAIELLEVADRHSEYPDARNPDRLRVIAETFVDTACELDDIADYLSGHRRIEQLTPSETPESDGYTFNFTLHDDEVRAVVALSAVTGETPSEILHQIIDKALSEHRTPTSNTASQKHRITSRDNLSFTIRGEHGGLINWNVKHDLEDYWSEHVEIGKRFFSEIVELAEHSEREALFGMLYAICSPTFRAGWGEEHGFVEMMSRAAIIGMRAIRNGADTHINLEEPGHDGE